MNWRTSVDAGDHEGQLRRDRRGDEDRRDRAEQRPDDRDAPRRAPRAAPSRSADGTPEQRVRDAGRRRRVAAMRISWPRTHMPSRGLGLVPDVPGPRPAMLRDERQHVALQAGVLGEPEVDDGQQRQERHDRAGDRHADRRRPPRPPGRRRPGGRTARPASMTDGDGSATSARGPEALRPIAARLVEERRQRGQRSPGTGRSPTAG